MERTQAGLCACGQPNVVHCGHGLFGLPAPCGGHARGGADVFGAASSLRIGFGRTEHRCRLAGEEALHGVFERSGCAGIGLWQNGCQNARSFRPALCEGVHHIVPPMWAGECRCGLGHTIMHGHVKHMVCSVALHGGGEGFALSCHNAQPCGQADKQGRQKRAQRSHDVGFSLGERDSCTVENGAGMARAWHGCERLPPKSGMAYRVRNRSEGAHAGFTVACGCWGGLVCPVRRFS